MMKLVVKSLRCARGGRILIPELSFSLARGEGMLVTGPNGAGKSTLLRAIAGLFEPQAGDIRLEGGDGEKSLAAQSHYIGHLNAVKPGLTALENLRFLAAYSGGDEGRAQRALAALDLQVAAHIPAAYLSAGQRRRLSLCRLALIPRPLWLLDEPAAALDAHSQDLLDRIIRDHLEAGGIVMAAVHAPLGAVGMRVIDLGCEDLGGDPAAFRGGLQ